MEQEKETKIELENVEKSEHQNGSDSTDKIIIEEKSASGRGHNNIALQKWISHSSPPSYWSNTFGLATLPWILCGFPSHVFLTREEESPSPEIDSISAWLKYLFDFSTSRVFATISVILGLITLLLNLLVITLVILLFNRLFVSPVGDYRTSFVYDVFTVICFICQVNCLDYVWVYGYKIKRLVANFDLKHVAHPKIKCGYRRTLLILIAVTIVGFAVRVAGAPNAFEVDAASFGWVATVTEKALLFANSWFICFFFLVYVTFGYGIRFELVILKSFVYSAVHRRTPPSARHLSKIKTLFTHVANHIVYVNRLFWAMSAIIILIVFCFVLLDADELRGIIGSYFDTLLQGLGKASKGNATAEWEEVVLQFHDRDFMHKVNLDIVWVVVMLGLVFYTLWETIVTNDHSRDAMLWLNDMVTGGGGTDSAHLLDKLLLEDEEEAGDTEADHEEVCDDGEEEFKSREDDGEDYGDTFSKVYNLRHYISLRMRHDNPSLLSIMFFGSIVPLLSHRLERVPF